MILLLMKAAAALSTNLYQRSLFLIFSRMFKIVLTAVVNSFVEFPIYIRSDLYDG